MHNRLSSTVTICVYWPRTNLDLVSAAKRIFPVSCRKRFLKHTEKWFEACAFQQKNDWHGCEGSLANNLADHARRLTAEKRDMGREVPLQRAIELSSQWLEDWLAIEMPPELGMEQEEQLLSLVAALSSLPEAQREAITFALLVRLDVDTNRRATGVIAGCHGGTDQAGPSTITCQYGARRQRLWSGEGTTYDMADGSQSCLTDAAVAAYLEAVDCVCCPTWKNS